ncbi:MAG: AMP-binding protein [Micromonosporaceae bacterium]|nr:AMP-binding protein [Micromonosporaceae bacterium]
MAELVTAAENAALQRRAAGGLRRAGLSAGDRVALFAAPSGALLAAALGALRTGVIPVVADPALTPAERAELLADADPQLVVDTEAGLAALLDAPPADLADAPLGRPMHYTSGTTGRRKGVWSGVLSEPGGRALVDEEISLWQLAADDLHLVLSPLHHSAPLRFSMCTLLAGGAVLLAGRFDPAAALELMRGRRPTTAFCVPTQLRRLRAASGGEPPPTGSFRLLAHAGEACPPDVKQWAVAAFAAGSVHEFYGSTEGQFTVCSSEEQRERPDTVGRARPGRSLTVDDDGVIWCGVPSYARFSYWRDPDKTAQAWNGDRFTVGDVGRLDDDGYLYLRGRREDLVISGGVNVYPREVERVLGECPGVAEIAVFGIPDEHWGQRLCAAVVGDVSPEALDAYARQRLSPAKRPKDYCPASELPHTATGKIRRADLPLLLSS